MIKFVIDKREYTWIGGYGAQFSSFERGIKEGDTRVIKNKLFFAYIVRRESFFKQHVGWCVYTGESIPTSENIDEVRKLMIEKV